MGVSYGDSIQFVFNLRSFMHAALSTRAGNAP